MLVTQIANVPAEILAEVFNCLFVGTLVIPSLDFATLWSVSQTCSQWRAIVLGLRYLWNDVAVGAPTQIRECRPILHLTNQCLLRSRGVPISIRFYESHLWDLYGGSPLTKLLIPYAAKLRCLSLGASMDLWPLVAPALEELETTMCGPGTAELISFIERSRCTIIRLTVYRGEGGSHRLLKSAPSLEEFRTDVAPTSTLIRNISRGSVGPALRSIHCHIVTRRRFVEFMDMLAARSSNTAFSRIVNVSLALDFHLGIWGTKRIQAFRDQGIEIRIRELVKRFQDSDTDESGGPGGYNSDKVCSLIFQ